MGVLLSRLGGLSKHSKIPVLGGESGWIRIFVGSDFWFLRIFVVKISWKIIKFWDKGLLFFRVQELFMLNFQVSYHVKNSLLKSYQKLVLKKCWFLLAPVSVLLTIFSLLILLI